MNQEALNYQREGNEVPNDSQKPAENSAVNDFVGNLIYMLIKWAFIIIAVVLCSPALIAATVIISWSYYYLTRKKMMQASEVGLYMGGTALGGLLLWFILDVPKKFASAFNSLMQAPGEYLSPTGIFDLVGTFSTPFTIAGIILGALLGWALAAKIQYDYNHNEELKYNDSFWMSEKKFKYRPTPKQRPNNTRIRDIINRR